MNLLIVEDDPVQLAGLVSVLTRCPAAGTHAVTAAGSLAAAEALLLSHPPFDCVLLDLGLPDGDGVESYRRVARADPQVPVVVVTGASEADVGLDLIHEGAQEFLQKGNLDVWPVCKAIAYAVERHKWRRFEADVRTVRRHLEDGADNLRKIAQQLREALALAPAGRDKELPP